MFVGHFGVGFGAKTVAPYLSLGSLFLASQFVDLLWPTLLLFGMEHVRIEPGITRVVPLNFVDYPISHGLLAVIGWAALSTIVYFLVRRYRRGAVVVGLLVVSHWLLDLVVHRPDLPLYAGSTQRFGLGLWSSVGATIAVELSILAVGVWLYVRSTVASDAAGRWALWGLVGFLVVVYLVNLFGAPPPNVTTLAWVGQAQWLLIAWGYWVDRHRRPLLTLTAGRQT